MASQLPLPWQHWAEDPRENYHLGLPCTAQHLGVLPTGTRRPETCKEGKLWSEQGRTETMRREEQRWSKTKRERGMKQEEERRREP